MKDFSVLMPFRDSERERRFAKESIPAILKLNPTEFIIGVDSPIEKDFKEFILSLAPDCRIVEVPESTEWKMRLSHAMWMLYEAASCERALIIGVDVVPDKRILHGVDLVDDNTPIISYALMPKKNFSVNMVRYLLSKITLLFFKQEGSVNGLYYLHLPTFFEKTNLEENKSVVNGVDDLLGKQMEGKTILATNMIVGRDFGVGNPNIPWRQFQLGIWHASGSGNFRRMTEKSGGVGSMLDKIPYASVTMKAILTIRPWMLRGYAWARKNKNHEAVKAASGETVLGFIATGSKYVDDVGVDWKKHGWVGTGW